MIKCQNLKFGYATGPQYRANFDLQDHDILLVSGPNGSGKSTLLKAIAGIVQPSSGRFVCTVLPQDIYMIFASENLFPGLSVRENLRVVPGVTDSRVNELLKKYQLAALADKYPENLSSGQQQLVALLRVFLVSHKLILLDEPTNFLASGLAKQVGHDLCAYIKKTRRKMIIVSHATDIFKSKVDACVDIEKIVECLN